jgi:hypothetical protein
MSETNRQVVMVVESHWGNTRRVADRIADGLRRADPEVEVTMTAPGDSSAEVPEGTALLLVGGPTHAFSMTREKTRADAHERGATSPMGPGIRDWIDRSEVAAGPAVRTFDTRVRHFPGSAARSAAKALHKHGWSDAEAGESFFVTGQEGPLADGELDRAEAWGAELARLVHVPG